AVVFNAPARFAPEAEIQTIEQKQILNRFFCSVLKMKSSVPLRNNQIAIAQIKDKAIGRIPVERHAAGRGDHWPDAPQYPVGVLKLQEFIHGSKTILPADLGAIAQREYNFR